VELLLARHPLHHTARQMNFVDNHDVARFVTVVGGDRASVELANLLLFTFPGAPCVYYGAEVGMTGGMPPAGRAGFPPPQRCDHDALARHRRRIALRRAHPALRAGDYQTVFAEGGAYGFLRRLAGDALFVGVNAGETAATVAVEVAPGDEP